MADSRFIVGIDLGTTNIAVTYVDTEKSSEIELFQIPQLTAPGEFAEAELLPSFFFYPDCKQISEGALKLPWNSELDYSVGLFARNNGPETPSRFISSAKSWLCHGGVDRRAKILPWNCPPEERAYSPLQITHSYLKHIQEAWDHKFKRRKDKDGTPCRLKSQQVVVTVPASFDETARELTLEAARLAGFVNLTLLEEPLAAFYSWLHHHDHNWQALIQPGENVLVVDVGGGTCDFSFIEMDEDGTLNRSVAGDHLLLGGDNIDIALAKRMEAEWGRHLQPGEWALLCQKTRQAKETLLSDSALAEVDVVMLFKGSSLIGNMQKSTIKRDELLELLNSGFFPEVAVDKAQIRRKAGLQSMGLPYAQEPAVTAHLLDFLRQASVVVGGQGPKFPNKVLFNGGTMIPDHVRKLVMTTVNSWFTDAQAEELDAANLHTAVAFGASYYGRTRRGDGVKVKSGTTRSYYIQVADDSNRAKYICVMPRGIDENHHLKVDRKFLLEANQTVSFPLFSSSTRINDQVGDVVECEEELSSVSRLVTVIKFGKAKEQRINTEIAAELNETGVLQLSVEAVDTDHAWPLKFDVRLIAEKSEDEEAPITTVAQDKLDAAFAFIRESFETTQDQLPGLIKQLEKRLELGRKEWPMQVLREVLDVLLAIPYKSLKTKPAEVRWLNLAGFCMRPGFGDPADELRMKKIWPIWLNGINNGNDAQAVAEWWIFWRRVAPGLKPGHQQTVFDRLYKGLCPKGKYVQNIKAGAQPKAEMWRALGAMEQVPVDRKTGVGNVLLKRLKKLEDYELWCLARLGTRRLFRAPVNHVISINEAEKWVKILTEGQGNVTPLRLFAISRIAALSGDRHLDLHPEVIEETKAHLLQYNAPMQLIHHLETSTEEDEMEQAKILGDSLPLGLKLAE